MKKYWFVAAASVVVICSALLLVINKDKKETVSGEKKAVESTQNADSSGNTGVINVNSKAGDKGISSEKEKQDEMIKDIRRMYQPEWERINQNAEKRLTALIREAEKEYKVKKERNIDVSRLEGKYRAIYNDYEESTKTLVDTIISNMQKEAIEKGLKENIGDEYFDMYEIQKEKRIEKVVTELKKLS
ncbi:hypothetical protein [Neobacillus vireti]|uniref:hypothetical protein n=1 Tax=Neobacillus vireti TaxID=220686 RepID=UPI002FFD6E04